MAAGDTAQTICTTALFNLGAAPLSSFQSPVTPLEIQIVSQYQLIVNSELRRKDWTFAIMRTQFTDPATPATPPAFNTYPLPADCIRVLREHHRMEDWHAEPRWWLEGRNVCSRGLHAPNIRYISNLATPAEYDPLFVMVLGYKLALHCAEYTTSSSQKKQDLASLYQGAIAEAGKQNAWEQPQGTTHAPDNSFSWLADRADFRY